MEERRQKQKEHLLGWLAAVDNREDYELHNSDHIVNTSEWLLEEEQLKAWLSTDRSDVFWLSGEPGTGKTFLATHLISHLTKANKHVVYFYFKFDDPAKRTTLGVLRSLSAQLLTQIPLPDDYRAVYEENREENLIRLNDVDVALTGLKILLQCLPWRIHIVIDGLDECMDKDTLVASLKRLCFQSGRGITKWFLTSQPNTAFAACSEKQELKHFDIATHGKANIEKDIKLLIEQYGWAASDEAENALLERARGNILWTKLALRTLDNEHMAVREEYDRIQIIEELEPGLFNAFLRSLKRWAERPAKDMKLARMYLNFVSVAERPLTLDELDEAIGLRGEGPLSMHWYNSPDSAKLFYRKSVRVGTCALLQHVKSSRSDKVFVRLGHKQFKDFFLLDPSHKPFRARISPRTSSFFLNTAKGTIPFVQGDLGAQCLYYLLNHERYRTAGLDTIFNPATLPNEEFDKLLNDPAHSFLVYAATHWHIHVSEWNEDMQECLAGGIITFMNSENFLLTVRVQARRAPHLLASNSDHLPIPSWLSRLKTDEAKRLVWTYGMFIREWGYVLAASSGDLRRIAVWDAPYGLLFPSPLDGLYTRHSLATKFGSNPVQSSRSIYDNSNLLREGYKNIPHVRISAIHNTGGGSFAPEVMLLDAKSKALDLTCWTFKTYVGRGKQMLVNTGNESSTQPISRRIALPEHILMPTESEAGHFTFSVQTARKGTKVVISLVYSNDDCCGNVDDHDERGGPTGSTALGVFDIGSPEESDETDMLWFNLDGLEIEGMLADTSTPTFHPSEPVVLWVVSGSELVVGNYETGKVDVIKYTTNSAIGKPEDGGREDTSDGGDESDNDDDGSDDGGNADNYTYTIALQFLNASELLISTLKSSPTSSSLTLTIYNFPSTLDPTTPLLPLTIPPQSFTWTTTTPPPSWFFHAPYSLTLSSTHLLLTHYHNIDITHLRIPFSTLTKPLSERYYESLLSGISLPTSSREPAGIWREAPKCVLLTGDDLVSGGRGEKAVGNDVLVWGLKSDSGVEESVAWLRAGRERWVRSMVVGEEVGEKVGLDGEGKREGGDGSESGHGEEGVREVEEGVVDLSRLFYGQPDQMLFEDEPFAVPVRTRLNWDKPTYAICCMRR